MRISQSVRSLAIMMTVLYLALAGCAGQTSAGTGGGSAQTPSVTPTETSSAAQPTSTVATLGGSAPWYTWTEPQYGYKLDLPGYVAPQSTIGFGVQGEGFVWQTPSRTDTNQITSITVESATQLQASDCVQGKAITIGSGISGVENDGGVLNGTPPPGSGSPGSTIIAAFSSNGVYVVIRVLAATHNGQTFQQEYGATWQHILSSFTPGLTSFGSTSPCA